MNASPSASIDCEDGSESDASRMICNACMPATYEGWGTKGRVLGRKERRDLQHILARIVRGALEQAHVLFYSSARK